MKKIVLSILLILIFPIKAFAPVHGPYPGINYLIKEANIIAVIEIKEKIKEYNVLISYEDYNISVMKVLKGTLPDKSIFPIELRYFSTFTTLENNNYKQIIFNNEFENGNRYLVFLIEDSKSKYKYRNLNDEGSHWLVSKNTDLKNLSNSSIVLAIISILHESLMDIPNGAENSKEKEIINMVIKELET